MNFNFEIINPVLTSRINKSGPIYKLSFEIDRSTYISLSEINLANYLYTCVLLQHDAAGNLPEKEPEKEEKEINFWSDIIKKGYFYNHNFLDALGGDEAYLQHLQTQPSAISADYSEYVNGEGRSIVAHVRRSGDAGTGYKPKYSAIPLTYKEHAKQHADGEESLKPRSWWEKTAAKYLINYAKYKICKVFSVDSLNEISEKDFKFWCEQNGVDFWKNQQR